MAKATRRGAGALQSLDQRRRGSDRQPAIPGFPRLLAAERKMLAAYLEGKVAAISDSLPLKPAAGLRIRGKVIRALLLAPDVCPRGGTGLAIEGAYIEGMLDLSVCKLECLIKFSKCRIEQRLWLYGSSLWSVSLEGCRVPGIHAEYLQTSAALFLNKGFESDGEVRLVSARIGGSLECTDAKFRNPRAIAFNGQDMTVSQGFLWRRVAQVDGRVDLVDAEVGTLVDDIASWLLPNDLVLDGFVYGRIDSKDIDSESRIRWIKRQRPQLFGEKFWSQPWEQLAKVMRDTGHLEEAKLVSMEKQREMRRQGLVGSRKPAVGLNEPWRAIDSARVILLNLVSRLLHRAYGALAGYGYRPLRTFMLMASIWLMAAAAYSAADLRGLIVPTATSLLTDEEFRLCGPASAGGIRWTHCPRLPRDYTTFDPLMYSLDVILPLVDLKQENDWEPAVRRGPGWRMWDGLLIRGIMWFEILFGWIGSLLIVSALGRLVQKD